MMSGSPLFRIMYVILRCRCGEAGFSPAHPSRAIEFYQGGRDGTSVLLYDHEPLGSRTDFLWAVDKAQFYRRRACWPVMQYGPMRRQRVMKELRRGRPLSAEDMPVATALVDKQRSRRRWLVPFWVLMAINWLLLGLSDNGFMRWAFFGVTACWVAAIPLQLREQRQLIRNYERQNTPNVNDHRDDVAP
jgi:hypothetical protein